MKIQLGKALNFSPDNKESFKIRRQSSFAWMQTRFNEMYSILQPFSIAVWDGLEAPFAGFCDNELCG